MRIDSKEHIADVGILKIRDLLRRVNNTDEWEDGFRQNVCEDDVLECLSSKTKLPKEILSLCTQR